MNSATPRSLLSLGLLLLGGCVNPPSQVERWRAGVEELRNRSTSAEFEHRSGSSARYALAQPSLSARLRSRVRDGMRSERVIVGGSPRSLYIFDVSDLLNGIRDFPGPSIGDLRRPEDRPDHGERGASERTAFMHADDLIDLVRTTLASGATDEEDVSIANGKLIVSSP